LKDSGLAAKNGLIRTDDKEQTHGCVQGFARNGSGGKNFAAGKTAKQDVIEAGRPADRAAIGWNSQQ
jgi:hypothetical protein